MYTNSIQTMAFAEFEKASNEADVLAERIGKWGRAGESKATMVELLTAWQAARHDARSSHERLLAQARAEFGHASHQMAKAN